MKTQHQRAVAEQDRYYARKAAKICVKCDTPAAPEHVHCWPCIRKNRARVETYYRDHPRKK